MTTKRAMGFLAAVLVTGCGTAAPPPAPAPGETAKPAAAPAAPSKEPIDTGNACVKAQSQCGGGVCLLTIKNDCDNAVSCDARMITTCKSNDSLLQAERRKRDTFAAKTTGELSLDGLCPEGQVMATSMKTIGCK